MGVMIERARVMNEWVIINYRDRIFVLASLQCLFFTSFTSTACGARSHLDTATELHRSMARYRHLLELENSKSDTKIQGAGLENGDQEQELDTREQPQDEVREGATEGNATNLGTFVFPDPYLLGPTIKDWDEQRSSWLEQNPDMKSTLNKPRVLMVTGSQPKPCVSPLADHFHVRPFKLKMRL
ncbi:unnamed protein product [Calypogeia fissa]